MMRKFYTVERQHSIDKESCTYAMQDNFCVFWKMILFSEIPCERVIVLINIYQWLSSWL